MNTKFGKLVNGGVVFAPSAWMVDNGWLCNPQRADYLRAGWLDVSDVKPECGENYQAVATGWQLIDGVITRVYSVEAIPTPVKTYSKLRIVAGAKNAGCWEALKEWIVQEGYEDLWSAAQDLCSDYNGWEDIVREIVNAGVASDSVVKAILDGAVVD